MQSSHGQIFKTTLILRTPQAVTFFIIFVVNFSFSLLHFLLWHKPQLSFILIAINQSPIVRLNGLPLFFFKTFYLGYKPASLLSNVSIFFTKIPVLFKIAMLSK